MESKRCDLSKHKLSHNEFPKLENIPKNIFNDFVISLETEIRAYYMNKENIKKNKTN